MLFSNKKTDDSDHKPDKSERVVAAISLPDFIPYHSHYDAHTLITKNGELMQIIKIATNMHGLDYESGDNATLREMIRQALQEHVRTDKLAFWVHTLRKRRSITYKAEFKEPFAAYVHQQWQLKNRWRYQYYNEVYLTILHEGQSVEMFNQNILKRTVLPGHNRAFRNAYLQEAHQVLGGAVQGILSRIRQHYHAQLLSVTERSPDAPGTVHGAAFYSEPMEFLGTLLNLRQQAYPVSETDLSVQMANHGIVFGFNAVESKNEDGKRRFGALLSLKQYREVPSETVDRLLQAPMEFIISQSFSFIPHQKALRQYKEQKQLFDTSGDIESIRASGIEDMIHSHKNNPTDFGDQQTTITVMVDEFKQLDADVVRVQAAFADLGLLTIREDIRLEECFWAQLPGNFEFLRRTDPINTVRFGGFVRLNRFPQGQESGNHWGDAVTMMPTRVESPYFFNFHHRDNGHTLWFDFNSFNDYTGRALLYFLLTETRKYNGRLYVFDRHRSTHLYFDKLGGHYHSFAAPAAHRNAVFRLNPFTLDDTPRNQAFLLAWCGTLLKGHALTEHHKDTLRTAIAQLYTGPQTQRSLAGLAQLAGMLEPSMASIFADWLDGGTYAGLFNFADETLHLEQLVHAFDMTRIIQRPESVVPVFSYLMHRIINAIDGKPTIIVLHEAWDLLENPFFAPRLESLLDMLKQNNVMMVFTASRPQDCAGMQTFGTLMQQCATRIYVPDEIEADYEAEHLGLGERDAHLLRRMDRQHGEFLLQQDHESIALRIDVKELDDIYAIFGNDIKNLFAAGGAFASLPKSVE